MSQLNINMSAEFERDLNKLMRLRHIKTKSEAIKTAVKESLEHFIGPAKPINFLTWVGLGKQAPMNKKNKFHSDDDLWK